MLIESTVSLFVFEFLSLLICDVSDVVTNTFVFSLKFWRVVPLFHFGKHIAFSLSNCIFTIDSSDGLHWPGLGIVIEIKHSETGGEGFRRLNVVSECDIWICFLESSNISYISVEFSNFVSSKIVTVRT
jgi:hypothetical protein